MRKVCAFFASLFLATLPLFAQSELDSISFEGRVVNAQGIPVKDAVVMAVNSGVSLMTGLDGLFNIKVPSNGETIVISKEGLATFEYLLEFNLMSVVVLTENGTKVMANSDYIKQMEGTAKTYYETGLKFLEGDAGNGTDYKKAFACFWRSANMEHLLSKYYVGKMYEEGLGVAQNYTNALEWYEKAKNTVEAQRRMGDMYAEGIGVEQDYKKAAQHYQFAIDRGDSIVAAKNLAQLYEKGLLEKEIQIHDDDIVYEVVEENAQYPGGDKACYQWLAQHVKYPKVAQEQGIQGRVMVQFVVNKDGSIVDVTILRSPDPSLAKEAYRVVRQMPKWKPASQNRKAVRSRFTLPVIFRLT